MRNYYVYWLQSGNRAYIGATVNPARRLRQHNGELVGGARRTRLRGPWHFHCVVTGFRTWREALQYEWAAKHYSRRCRSIAARGAAIDMLHARERWTSNSPLASEVDLQVEFSPTLYGEPPRDTPAGNAVASRGRREQRRGASQPKRRAFKTRLHGVSY